MDESEVGARIRALRKALGLTQREFAEKLGMYPNTVAIYESGKRFAPSASTLKNICWTFGASEEWLRTGEGEMFQNRTAAGAADAPDGPQRLRELYPALSWETLVLIDRLVRLPPDSQAAVIAFFREVVAGLDSSPPVPVSPDAPERARAAPGPPVSQGPPGPPGSDTGADSEFPDLATAEAAYEKRWGIVRDAGSSVSNTTGGMDSPESGESAG